MLKDNRIKCDCGHRPRDHYCSEGCCDKCGCTWYHPNAKYILTKQLGRPPRKADWEKLRRSLCG